jgi:hypothetical protein
MAVGTYMVNPFLQYFTDAGAVLNGGTLTFYAAGTETPLDTYSDVGMLTPNENPMELDSAGRAETAVFFSAASYKVVLKTSADTGQRLSHPEHQRADCVPGGPEPEQQRQHPGRLRGGFVDGRDRRRDQ